MYHAFCFIQCMLWCARFKKKKVKSSWASASPTTYVCNVGSQIREHKPTIILYLATVKAQAAYPPSPKSTSHFQIPLPRNTPGPSPLPIASPSNIHIRRFAGQFQVVRTLIINNDNIALIEQLLKLKYHDEGAEEQVLLTRFTPLYFFVFNISFKYVLTKSNAPIDHWLPRRIRKTKA